MVIDCSARFAALREVVAPSNGGVGLLWNTNQPSVGLGMHPMERAPQPPMFAAYALVSRADIGRVDARIGKHRIKAGAMAGDGAVVRVIYALNANCGY